MSDPDEKKRRKRAEKAQRRALEKAIAQDGHHQREKNKKR